jgi:hypothetical protein
MYSLETDLDTYSEPADLETHVDLAAFAPHSVRQGLELVLPGLAITGLLERFDTMNREVYIPAGLQAKVSLLPSVAVKASKIAPELAARGIKIGSFDVPYSASLDQFVRGLVPGVDESLIRHLQEHVGFTLLNTVGYSQWQSRVVDGLETMKTYDQTPTLIRTSSDFWTTKERLGNFLLERLKATPGNYLFLVEISAYDTENLNSYYELIATLNARYNERGLSFAISFDSAHMGQMLAWENTPVDKREASPYEISGEDVVKEFGRILAMPELVRFLASVELNQVGPNNETHYPVNKGIIDLSALMLMYGSARRDDISRFLPRDIVIVEDNPAYYPALLNDRGNLILFYKQLKAAYRNSLS